ncbi:MAG: hypothetical protein GXP31_12470 [Kiritimatiellaeota bacterium]|nr:hypothetical protein [Kiritimatiellota bacterium]
MEFKYARGSVTSEDLIGLLVFSGRMDALLKEAIERREVRRKAMELDIRASDEELQAAADRLRKELGLVRADVTMAFLTGFGLTVEDLQEYCEFEALREKVRERLTPEAKINEYFLNYRADFDRATISIITVDSEELARELIMRVVEDGEDFHELASEYSLDEGTRENGGRVGAVPRSAYSPEVSAKIFNADPGDVVGPFSLGDRSLLILVEKVEKGGLTDEARTAVRDRIYQDWLHAFLRAGISVAS